MWAVDALADTYRDNPEAYRVALEAIFPRITSDSQLLVESYIQAMLDRTHGIRTEKRPALASRSAPWRWWQADDVHRLADKSADLANQINRLLPHVTEKAIGPRTHESITTFGKDGDDIYGWDWFFQTEPVFTVYQPIFRVYGTTVAGYEALSRLDETAPSGMGIANIPDLLHKAQSDGVVVDLERLLIRRALQDATEKGITDATFLSLNISPTVALDVLSEFPTEYPAPLQVEFLERKGINNEDLMVGAIAAYRACGITVALDDLGAGFADIETLIMLLPDVAKVDRSWIVKEDAGTLLSVITRICRDHGIQTVAEGVETEDQLWRIHKAGFDLAQGFFLAKPQSKIAAATPKIASPCVLGAAPRPLLLDGKSAVQSRALQIDERIVADVVRFREEYLRIMPQVVEDFYRWLSDYPRLMQLIQVYSSLPRQQELLTAYLTSLVTDPLNCEFVRGRQAVGVAHEQFGVSISWFLIGYERLVQLVYSRLTALLSGDALVSFMNSFRMLVEFDRSLVLESYEDAMDYDRLTRLYSRNGLERRFKRLLAERASHSRIGMAVLDLDRFKYLNDTYGHLYGDRVLAKIGGSLKKFAHQHEDCFIGRYGGDEFVIVTEPPSIEVMKGRILEMAQSLDLDTWGIGCSAGMILGDSSDRNIQFLDLFGEADAIMYAYKKGRSVQLNSRLDGFRIPPPPLYPPVRRDAE